MRLIDADALQNILLIITTALEHEYGSLGGAVSGCMKHIDNAPTVDAVPVVRCRECIAYTPVDDNTGKCVFLIGEHQYVVPDGYCYLGERKEGADNGM